MKKKIIIAFVASIAAGSAAQAQETGEFRVEALGGWDDVVAHAKLHDFATDERFEERGSKSGATYGVGAGYDFVSESGLVVGPLASAMWATTKSCGELIGDDRACLKAGRELEGGARLGQRYSGSGGLAYVKLAYVNARARATHDDGVDRFSDHDDRSGVRVGIGFEQPIASRFYLKAEYRYTDFKDYKIADDEASLRYGFERHQVVGGAGIRF